MTEPPNPTPAGLAATIDGHALVEFRAARVSQSLRALGSSAPVAGVCLAGWDPALTVLVVIAGAVALASGWASVHAIRELRLPLRERYTIVDDALIHEIGEAVRARIPRAKLRTMMRDPNGFVVAGRGGSVCVPRAADGFEPLVAALAAWGPVVTRGSVARDAASTLGVGGLIRAALIGAALVFVVITTGEWLGIALGVGLGLAAAELLARILIERARARARIG